MMIYYDYAVWSYTNIKPLFFLHILLFFYMHANFHVLIPARHVHKVIKQLKWKTLVHKNSKIILDTILSVHTCKINVHNTVWWSLTYFDYHTLYNKPTKYMRTYIMTYRRYCHSLRVNWRQEGKMLQYFGWLMYDHSILVNLK